MASTAAGSPGAVAVMGAGAWGTALAKVLADAGGPERRSPVGPAIRRRRARSTPPDTTPPICRARCCRRASAPPPMRARRSAGATTVLLGVPAQTMRANLEQWAPLVARRRDTGQPGQGHRAGHPDADEPGDRFGDRRGPGTGRGRFRDRTWPVRSPNASPPPRSSRAATPAARLRVQRMLNSGYFRPYTNSDVVGTEIGGACKNVIALACGMAAGVGLGENTAAAIITRGLAEIMRLGIALGAKGATLAGLAGVGDLVATCTSPHSRNRSFGERLGRGGTMESATQAGAGARRRGRDVVRGGARAGVQLRRRDATHRRRAPGVSQGTVGGRGDGAAAGPQHQARMRRCGDETPASGPAPDPGAPQPVASPGCECQRSRVRVAVVFGGRSNEHAISCVSAGSILRNLDPTAVRGDRDRHHPGGFVGAHRRRPRCAGDHQPAAARGDRRIGHRAGAAGGSGARRPVGVPVARCR